MIYDLEHAVKEFQKNLDQFLLKNVEQSLDKLYATFTECRTAMKSKILRTYAISWEDCTMHLSTADVLFLLDLIDNLEKLDFAQLYILRQKLDFAENYLNPMKGYIKL